MPIGATIMSKISVIIPTHNRRPMLMQAIDSALSQSHSDIEILVIDDCSKDDTAQYLSSKQEIIVISNSQPGNAGVNRQKAYHHATGEFIAFLDDDDFYSNHDFFADAIRILQEDESLVAVTSNATVWHTDNDTKDNLPLPLNGKMRGNDYLNEFTLKYPKPWSTFTTVFRKSLLDEAGFNDMSMMNDTSIYLRALCMGDIYFLSDISGVYRIHANNISKRIPYPFIIANLNEKTAIFELIQKRKIKVSFDWLNRQLFTTIKYYIKESQPTKTEIMNLIGWILRKRGFNGVVMGLRSMYLYNKIKRNQPKQQ
jgi:glycosyltransferase involved in cell wall biosynthesis